jgi:hypothetical protein
MPKATNRSHEQDRSSVFYVSPSSGPSYLFHEDLPAQPRLSPGGSLQDLDDVGLGTELLEQREPISLKFDVY